jgi:nucleoside transporter
MMFLQYFVLGSTVPIMSLYLTEYLSFSGVEAGLILSMSAVAAFISPLAGAIAADRIIGSERLYGFCHLAAGTLMALLSVQTRFQPFLLIYLAYMLVFGPTMALSNAVTFHHLPEAKQTFGGIRMWGTIGWIAVAWLFGFLWLRAGGDMTDRIPDALKLSALSSICLGVYAFALPKRETAPPQKKQLIPVESFRVLFQRNILLLAGISFLISFINRFYYFGTGPFLNQIGFDKSAIMPAMSLGQIPEVFAMGLLGFFLMRFGQKRVIAMGVFMELARFSAFVVGAPRILVFAGICFHGIAFAFFFSAAHIYLDTHCDERSRAGAHQLFAIITSGFGSFFGSLASGKILDIYRVPDTGLVDFHGFWMVPASLAVLALVIIGGFLKNPSTTQTTPD